MRDAAALVLCFGALVSCATTTSEASAIRRGCHAIKAAYGAGAVRCADLRATLSAEGTQWVVLEQTDGLHPKGAALSRADGRVLNTWH